LCAVDLGVEESTALLHGLELARRAGVRDEAIAAIRERRAPAGLTPAEAQVTAYASALLREHRVSDEAFAALQKRFGLEGLVDLTATIGYYAMIACALNAFAIEPTFGEPPLPV
jgi:4-carboxymuconolactone decarboxylase